MKFITHESSGEGFRHPPHNLKYANAIDRERGVNEIGSNKTLTMNQIYQYAIQQDDNSIWMLVSINPISWVSVKGNSPVNIRDFGAKGIEGIDDTQAIQMALDTADSMSNGRGSEVTIPSGVFIYTKLELNNYQTLTGEDGAVLKLKDNFVQIGAIGGIMGKDGVDSITIKNLELDGNHQNQRHDLDRDSYHIHGVNCSTNNGKTTPPREISLHNLYIHSNMRNSFITFDFTQPDGTNRMSFHMSDVRSSNNLHDHHFYLKRSDGNISNLTITGYWAYSAIASYGQNFSNVIFKDVVENPDPAYPTQIYIQDRVAANKRTQIKNMRMEFNPSVSNKGFNLLNSSGILIDGLTVERVGSPVGNFDLFEPSINTANNIFKNIQINNAHSEFSILDTGNENTVTNTTFEGVSVFFEDGQYQPNALFEIYTDTIGFFLKNIKVGPGFKYLLWVHPGVTIDNFILENADLDNDVQYRAHNISDIDTTIGNIIIRDSRCKDNGSTVLNDVIKFENCNFGTKKSSNRGINNLEGDGEQTAFEIITGIVKEPLYYTVHSLDNNQHGPYSISTLNENILITFDNAPSNTVRFSWAAEISN
jgi:hypothetical protein